ncbi:MAG: SDR family oxidoreductase [Acidimicrobiales bacterium]|jgi:short-subunit dehydrogenase
MSLPAARPDRTCLVTGASSGIGQEIAGLLAGRGLGVTLVARTESKLQALAESLSARHGVQVEVLPTDLADAEARRGLPGRVADLGLAVNVLVNNAGFSTLGPVYRSDPDREIAMIRTDVEAVVHLCSLFTPGMVERRSGCILNVASTAAFQPIPGQAGYGGAKAFVLSYSHAIREELRSQGVTVTALCPGPVETGFAEAAGIDPDQMAGAMPRIFWVPAGAVARAGVAGMDANRAVVIPGLPNRASAALGWLSPRRLLVPVVARQHPAMRDF